MLTIKFLTPLAVSALISLSGATATADESPVRDCGGKPIKVRTQCKRNNYLDRLDRRCKHNTVIPCIKYAARKYHQSYPQAYGVAFRESTLNRFAVNGSHVGLYQFDSQTFYDSRNPHKDEGGRTSARASSLSAMWFWHIGETSRWAQTY